MRCKNRKARKARWQRFKNAYARHPDCVYGVAFCDHVYEARRPWQWVDFRFPSFTRRRFYEVAAATLNFLALEAVETRVFNEVDRRLPLSLEEAYGPAMIIDEPAKATAPCIFTLSFLGLEAVEAGAFNEVDRRLRLDLEKAYGPVMVIDEPAKATAPRALQSNRFEELRAERAELESRLLNEYAQEPIRLRERIIMRFLKNDPVAIGLWVHVNRDKLEPSWLNEFAHWFNASNFPLRPGTIWEGEEVEIIPARLLKGGGDGE